MLNLTNNGIKDVLIKASDWIHGQHSGIAYKDNGGGWSQDLPLPEKQSDPRFDTFGCVSFSATNCIETQCNRLWRTGAWSKQNMAELQALGVVDANGKFNFSDRFVAKMSNTKKDGNLQQTVWDTIRTYGLVGEQDWPFTQDMDWDSFYSEIPQEIKDKALKILDYIDIAYEWVIINSDGKSNVPDILRYQLKQAPVQVTTAICPGWAQGRPVNCGRFVPAHAYMVYDIDGDSMYFMDQYDPFLKTLPLDYPVPFGLKAVVTAKNEYLHNTLHYGQNSPEVKKLQQFLNASPDTAITGISGFPGTKGNETNYYGPSTANAVLRLQQKYGGFSTWELLWYAGKNCGPKTLALINRLANGLK